MFTHSIQGRARKINDSLPKIQWYWTDVHTGIEPAAATLSAHLDIDVEDALEAVRSEPTPDLIRGHDRLTFGRRVVLRLIRRFGRVALTPFGGRHQRTVHAVRGKYTVKAGEVDAWPGHQGGEVRQSKLDSGKTDSEATLRGAAKLDWAVSKTSQFTEVLTVEGGEDVTVTKSVNGLSSQINGSLSMKTTYTYKNTSEAPLGVEDTDTETAVTLVYKL